MLGRTGNALWRGIKEEWSNLIYNSVISMERLMKTSVVLFLTWNLKQSSPEHNEGAAHCFTNYCCLVAVISVIILLATSKITT